MAKPSAPDISAAIARAARKELEVRRALPTAFAGYEATLFPWQLDVVRAKDRRIVLFPGRRSGKTHTLGAAIIGAAIRHPGSTIPVFERTTTCQAAVVLWKFLQEANERYALGMTFHHSLLRATLPNRTEIIIIGADTVEAADKARGNAYPVVFIDEAGTFRGHILHYLLTDVLEPALLDYQGQLVMAGTPPPRWTNSNPFYIAAHSNKWKHVHATFRDNDALPLKMEHLTPAERAAEREADFRAMLERNGWDETTPCVQREWLGLWVQDMESLLYRMGPGNHTGVVAPDTKSGDWNYALGVDFGYNDACAFVVLAWKRGDARVWVLESYESPHLIPSAVAAHVERLMSRYDFRIIIGDTGGQGKAYAEELRQKFGVPIEAARKRGKLAYTELLNGALASCVLQIVPRTNEDLIEDLYTVRRDPATGAAEEADHAATHLPDALRYVYTEVSALNGLGDADGPAPGTAAWHAAEARRMEALAVERYRKERGGDAGVWNGPTLDDALDLLG